MNRLKILAVIAMAVALPATITAANAASVTARILANANASMATGTANCPTYLPNGRATTTLGLSNALNCSLSNNANALSANPQANSFPSSNLNTTGPSLLQMQPQ